MKKIIFIVVFSLSACRSDVPNTDFDRLPAQNTSGPGPAVQEGSENPPEDAENVGLREIVQVTFNTPIDINSLWEVRFPQEPELPFRFRVIDQLGNPVYGEVQVTNDARTIQFQRKSKFTLSTIDWDVNSRYEVFVGDLRSSFGEPIHNYSWRFYTGTGIDDASSLLRVTDTIPHSQFINAQDAIDIEFNYSIGEYSHCSYDQYLGVVHTWVVETNNAEGNFGIPALRPQICILCNGALCNKMRIRPDGGWPAPSSIANFLVIKLFPNPPYANIGDNSYRIQGYDGIQRHRLDNEVTIVRTILRTNYGGGGP